jgi:hypothetical protein
VSKAQKRFATLEGIVSARILAAWFIGGREPLGGGEYGAVAALAAIAALVCLSALLRLNIYYPNKWVHKGRWCVIMTMAKHQELLRQGEELNKLIRQMLLTLGPLDADYDLAGKYWRSDKEHRQFWSRVVLRCLCADIEARLYLFRRTALEIANLSKATFTKDERETLTETRTVLENGVARTKPKWLPIKDSVKESLRLFGKSLGASATVDCSTKGFNALCDTFGVRHRLMHPKNVFAVEVRDKDIQTAEEGIHWFNLQCQGCLGQCQAHMAATIKGQLEVLRQKTKKRA